MGEHVAQETAQHWADQYAEEIIKKQKDTYIVESGITPSGIIHIGNFREIMTQDLVCRALLDSGAKARYQYYWDDYDRFRKVPKGVPPEYEQYIGVPVSKTPDPWGCHSSYSDHFKAPLIEENKACGINPEYVSATELYEKCTFADGIKTALQASEVCRGILDKFRKDPLQSDWSPAKVYCDKCGKDTTQVKYNGGYNVSYTCECGGRAELDFSKSGNIKLRWRVDWAMRWAHYDVDFESSGKDHHAAGGSWDTGVAICKEVFAHEPPIGPMYEFINVKGGTGKMSSSLGNVVTISTLLEVYEPEVIRYMYTGRINKAFDIPFDVDLTNIYNYFDSARRGDENEKRRYALSLVSGDISQLPQFSACANAVQIALGNIDNAVNILKKTGNAKEDNEHVRNRIKLAQRWVEQYAPDNFKFEVQGTMPSVQISPDFKALFGEIAEKIDGGIGGEDLQTVIYNTTKERGMPQKEVFSTAYRLVIGKPVGPRLGPFLVSLDKKFIVDRLKLIK
jgi:lysyl-tRNA synthetase class 1